MEDTDLADGYQMLEELGSALLVALSSQQSSADIEKVAASGLSTRTLSALQER